MPERDVSALFDATIRYPNVPSDAHPKGKTYFVASPSAADGAALTAQAALGTKLAAGKPLTDDERAMLQLDDEDERTFYQKVLGPVYDQMVEDGVDWTLITGIANDAFLVITDNKEMADAMLAVNAGSAVGEALARGNRASRRAAAKKSGAGKRKAGSKSSRASGVTQVPTPDPASTPSSTTPEAPEPEAESV